MLKINQRQNYLKLFLFLGFVLAASNALIAYVNSSYLGGFFGADKIGFIFIIAYLASLVAINNFPKIINRLRIFLASLAVLSLMFLGLMGLGLALSPWAAFAFFVIYIVCLNLIWISLDIYIEYFSSDASTGRIRGFYWTVVNAAWVLAPVTAGWLLGRFDYPILFYCSDALLLAVLVIFYFKFHHLEVDHFPKIYFIETVKRVWRDSRLNGIFLITFVLQLFYCVMVIYTPLYLHSIIGFDWPLIGIMFSIALVNFVYMPYPAGWLADKYLGEKEMLSVGLLIMGIFTIVFGLLSGNNFWLWLAVLFMTRVGASLVDIMKDTYFFKRVEVHDIQLINLFRTTGPLAYVVGPALALVAIYFFSYQYLFVFIGLVILSMLYFSLTMKDTK